MLQLLETPLDCLLVSHTVGSITSPSSGASKASIRPVIGAIPVNIAKKTNQATETTFNILEAINEARPRTTVAQAQAFMALVLVSGDADTPVTQDQIGDQLGRAQGIVSKQLDKFVEAGLLSKEKVPGSQLFNQYPLTQAGRALFFKLKRIMEG
jgi:DNA-binding MarR family transcriptional regulator